MSGQNTAMVIYKNQDDSEWLMTEPDNLEKTEESSNIVKAEFHSEDIKMFARIEIDESRCKGCGLCTIACPTNLLTLNGEANEEGFTITTITDLDKCAGCALCAGICPDIAIKVYSRQLNIFTGMDLLDRFYGTIQGRKIN
jgi:2-oxoglutarate ferredoxin oxidoreductase subunit delta